MKIRLLAFATAAQALGSSAAEIELPEGTTVAELPDRLAASFPPLRPLWPRLAVAVDGEIARGDRPLFDGAEVALLPPVSGG